MLEARRCQESRNGLKGKLAALPRKTLDGVGLEEAEVISQICCVTNEVDKMPRLRRIARRRSVAVKRPLALCHAALAFVARHLKLRASKSPGLLPTSSPCQMRRRLSNANALNSTLAESITSIYQGTPGLEKGHDQTWIGVSLQRAVHVWVARPETDAMICRISIVQTWPAGEAPCLSKPEAQY